MTIPDVDLFAFYKVDRIQAIKDNLKYYYTGPCGYGHDELRYASNGTCRECQRLRSREQGRKNIQKVIDNFNKRTYGLNPDEIKEIEIQQEFKCAVCESKFSGLKREKHLDHCHKTNKIRGLLCANCNTGLGLFKDDIKRLEKAIEYLRKHSNG